MPTATELINLAVKKSQQSTDEKIAHLQVQVDQLRQMVEKLLPPQEKDTGSNMITCRRCGRKGHWTLSCKATVDIKGNDLEFDEEYESE